MTENISVIGAGMIGGAIVKSLLKSGYSGKISAADCQSERIRAMEELGVAATADNRKAAVHADIVFVCVKPGDVEKVLKEISKEIEGKLVIPTAATIPLKFYKKIVPKAKFVRIMPNIAVMVQASYTAYCCDEDVTQEDKKKAKALFNMMGICEEVDEKYMDAITALSGSGTGNLVIELQEHPARIKDMVTTPGGTTIEAIYELEGSQIRQALMRAVEEATKKSQLIREKISINSK